MPTATFSGTYTANNGEDYAAGTVTLTPFGGSPVVGTLDATGAYSVAPTLVLTSGTGLWLNSAGEVVTSRPGSGSQLIPPGGTITRAKVRVEEAITGAPPKSYVVDVLADQVIDTSRDVGTVLGGAAAGLGVASVNGQTGAVSLDFEPPIPSGTYPEMSVIASNLADGGDVLDWFQAKVDALRDQGGGRLWVPVPPAEGHFFIDGSLQLYGEIELVMPPYRLGGAAGDPRGFVGNGVDPLFITGDYPGGSNSTHRNIKLTGISARNNGAPVLEAHLSHNLQIDKCDLSSFTLASGATLDLKFSMRTIIQRSLITCSGGGWAVDIQADSNGTKVLNNIITGGSAGGAVNFGGSVVAVLRNVIETSKKGIRAGYDSGSCYMAEIVGNYIENSEEPVNLGEIFTMVGGRSANFITNGAASMTPLYGAQVGRVRAMQLYDHVTPKTTEAQYKFLYDAAAAGVGATAEAEGCDIAGTYNGTQATRYDFSAMRSGRFAGRNRVVTAVDGATAPSGRREWISPVITANVGLTQTAIATDTTYGGWVEAVDILEVNGTIGCTIDIGSSSGPTDTASFDPSGVALTTRSGTQSIGVRWRSGSNMRVRVTAGAGTGNFRMRVRWRGV